MWLSNSHGLVVPYLTMSKGSSQEKDSQQEKTGIESGV
jgi:hypothetical protein